MTTALQRVKHALITHRRSLHTTPATTETTTSPSTTTVDIPIHSDADNVRTGTLINSHERAYIRQRRQHRHTKPTVGLALSGGGYRTLAASSAAMTALSHAGLTQCVDYISATSGASWYTSQLYTHHLTHPHCTTPLSSPSIYSHVHTVIRNRLTQHHMISTGTLNYRQVLQSVVAAYRAGRSLTIIDLLAYAVDATFLGLPEPVQLHASHTDALHHSQATLPYPLYNMVDSLNKVYYCATPHEYQCIDLHASVPVSCIGRTYHTGHLSNDNTVDSTDIPLHTVLAISGSAFCVDVDRMLTELKYHLPSAWLNILHYMIGNAGVLQHQLFAAYKLPNIVHDMPSQQLASKSVDIAALAAQPTVALSDAGSACNVPFQALLHRKCDVIICIDNSSPPEIYDAYAMKQMYAYGKQCGIKLPDVREDNITFVGGTDQPYKSLLGGHLPNLDDQFTPEQLVLVQRMAHCTAAVIQGSGGVPTIVYIPLIKSDQYDASYDPRLLCVQREHLQTFNLQYTEQQFDKLSGLMQHNIRKAAPVLKQVMNAG